AMIATLTIHGIPFRAIPDSGTITKYFALARSSEVASQPVDGTFCFVEPFPSAWNCLAAEREPSPFRTSRNWPRFCGAFLHLGMQKPRRSEANPSRRAKSNVRLSDGEDYLILKRASASRPSGDWSADDFDVLADGEVCRPYLQRQCGTRRIAVDVDVDLPATKAARPHTAMPKVGRP